MCSELFTVAAKKLPCPIKLWPHCHPKAHIDVYVDAKNRKIVLCCSACDRPLTNIHPQLPKKKNEKDKSSGT